MANKKKNKKNLEQELKRDKIMLLITSIIIVILLSLLIVSRNYRDFSLVNLKTNNKTIFSVSDLKINDLKDMLNKTGRLYADKPAYRIKVEEGKYQIYTHKKVRDMINNLGTALINLGLKGKRIAVIGENRYE